MFSFLFAQMTSTYYTLKFIVRIFTIVVMAKIHFTVMDRYLVWCFIFGFVFDIAIFIITTISKLKFFKLCRNWFTFIKINLHISFYASVKRKVENISFI